MLPRLHVVTNDAVLDRADFVSTARRMIERLGAALALHVRGRHTRARRVFDLTAELEPAARKSGALIVVNDRIDVAIATHARAVQLTDRSLPPHAARRILGPRVMIGWSAHAIADVERARADGADFVLLGTIWASASHPGGPVGGITLIRSAARQQLPLIAIGGVTPARVAEAVANGADGVAVISAVWDAADPVRSAQDLAQELRMI